MTQRVVATMTARRLTALWSQNVPMERVSVHHIDPFYGEMDIVFDAKKFSRRPPGTPADPYWHLCFQVFEDTTTFEPVVRTYCMYRPDASM